MTRPLPSQGNTTRRVIALACGLGGILWIALGSGWSEAESPAETGEEALEIMHASGAFEVELGPLGTYSQDAAAKIGRMSIDKTFTGDLAATSQGEMLTGGSPATGSAGYVAIERVQGTLHGRHGSFLLQHSATMTPAAQESTIIVVPASGTGDLEAIAGTMSIEIKDGQHFYSFEYSL